MPVPALPAADQLPPPDVIHRLAEAILQRQYYDLNASENVSPDFLLKLIKFIERILDPLVNFIHRLFDITPILGWLFCLLLASLAVFLVVHILYALVRAANGRQTNHFFEAPDQRETTEEWEERAKIYAEQGDLLGAVRALLRASLLRLHGTQQRRPRRGATNREWLNRFRGTPLFDSLRLLVITVDDRWYGDHPCTPDDYQLCRAAYASIITMTNITTRSHAQ